MLNLKPLQYTADTCPSCHHSEVNSTDFFFQGIHILAECHCVACDFKFLQTLPLGHAVEFPIVLSLPDNRVINLNSSNQWLAIPLERSFASQKKRNISVQIRQNRVIQGYPILLNCIDSCFGHLYAKVWNAQTLLKNHPQKDIIVLLPATFSWMVPEEVSEVWVVDIPITDAEYLLEGLDAWVKKQVRRFDAVQLSQAYMHLDHHAHVDLEKLLGQKRFDLQAFQQLPLKITFILREDRFWHGSVIMDFLYRLSVKFRRQRYLKSLFLLRQSYMIHKTARIIRSCLPHVKFYATGLGKTNSFREQIHDLRVKQINLETERSWNAIYAQSHLVIGIHGSHMLLPTSLAAGFINLLPRYKIDHIVEDTVLPYSNRMLQFMGRFLDEFANTSLVATHAVSIVKCFPMVWRNSQRIPEGE